MKDQNAKTCSIKIKFGIQGFWGYELELQIHQEFKMVDQNIKCYLIVINFASSEFLESSNF